MLFVGLPRKRKKKDAKWQKWFSFLLFIVLSLFTSTSRQIYLNIGSFLEDIQVTLTIKTIIVVGHWDHSFNANHCSDVGN
jgi:branched-subunit amino acid permease